MTDDFQRRGAVADDLTDFLNGVRLVIQCLLDNLNALKENEGMIGVFSY